MRYTLIPIFFFLNVIATMAQQNIDQAAINFKIKNIGMYVKGTFNESSIKGTFNINDLKSSFINITIPINSINTGITKRDKHLLEEDYFDVAKYPVIQFTSSKIEKKSNSNYQISGKLTIKDKTKNVTIPLSVIEEKDRLSISSNFTISRKAYGVGGKSWVLSDKVKAEVNFIVKK